MHWGAWRARQHASMALATLHDFFRQKLALYLEGAIQVAQLTFLFR